MKKVVTKLYVLGFSLLAAIIIAGCFIIVSVTQPSTIQGLEQFTAQLLVSAEGIDDANPHYGIVGIMVPNDWTIDSVWYSGGYTNAMAYLPPNVPDNEPGGQVDFWTDSLEGRYPSGADMMWVVYQSVSSHPVINDTLDVNLSIQMTPGVTQGTFGLGYFVSHAALDFTDPTYYSVSLNNNITVSGVVPVELTSFTGAGTKNGIQLNWETASEINNRGFEIERSTDNQNTTVVGFVKGNGTTTEKTSYSFIDKNISSGKYFYRLKQLDFSGAYEYSNTVEIDFSVPNEFFLSQNYPNPFNPATTLSFGLTVESDVTLSVYNSVGELVKVLSQGRMQAGTYSVNFEASELPSGIYLYTLNAKGTDGAEFTKMAKMLLLK